MLWNHVSSRSMSARILSIMLAVRVLSIFGRSTSGRFGVAAVDLSGDKDEMASDPELRYRWALSTFQEGLRFDAAASRDFCLSSFVSQNGFDLAASLLPLD